MNTAPGAAAGIFFTKGLHACILSYPQPAHACKSYNQHFRKAAMGLSPSYTVLGQGPTNSVTFHSHDITERPPGVAAAACRAYTVPGLPRPRRLRQLQSTRGGCQRAVRLPLPLHVQSKTEEESAIRVSSPLHLDSCLVIAMTVRPA